MKAKDYPRYFQALESCRVLPASDARTDPRTNEFAGGYLTPLGITSMMDAPIRLQGKLAGILCFEHVGPPIEWLPHQQDFAMSVAETVALALESSEHRKDEAALRDLNMALENAMPGISKLDAQGRYIEINDVYARALGRTPTEMIGKPWEPTVHPDDRPKVMEAFQEMLAKGKVEFEARGLRADSTIFHKRVLMVKILDSSGCHAGHHCFMRDITQQKQLENELAEQATRLRLMFQHMPGILWTTDTDLRFTSSQGSGLSALGQKPDDRVGMTLQDYFHTQDPWFPAIAMHRRALQGQSAAFDIDYNGRAFRCYLEPLRDPEGGIIGVIGVSLDITERNRAEQDLRDREKDLHELALTLCMAEELERQRIASGLHDHVGQALIAARMKLQILQQDLSESTQENAAQQISRLLEAAIQATRSLTFDLSPPVLHELGLEATLEWLAERYQKEHGLEVRCRSEGESKLLSREVRLVLYQATRELLMNVVKHAKATRADVLLAWGKGRLAVSVNDDGVGFTAQDAGERPLEPGHWGLFNIGQRLSHLGGCMEVESGPGRGTRVTLIGPLADPAHA